MRGPRTATLVAALALCGGCSLFLGDDGVGDVVDGPDGFGVPAHAQSNTMTSSVNVTLAAGEIALISVVTQQITPSSASRVRVGPGLAALARTHVSGGHSLQVFIADPGPGAHTALVDFDEPIPSLVTAIPVASASSSVVPFSDDGLTAPASMSLEVSGPDGFLFCSFAGVSDVVPEVEGAGLLWQTAFDGAFADAKGWTVAAGSTTSADITVDFLAAWAAVCVVSGPTT